MPRTATPQYDKIEADCPTPGPRCNFPSIPLHLPLGHSQWIEICASYNGVMYHGGASAYAQSNQRCSDKFVVNRLVVRYPRIAPPAGVPLPEVPFPDAPFQDCTGKQGTLGCDSRGSSRTFRSPTPEAYQKQGWLPPARGYARRRRQLRRPSCEAVAVGRHKLGIERNLFAAT